jgi:hypothetical protein
MGERGVENDPHIRKLTRRIERDPKRNTKILGEAIKRMYLTICITVHNGELEIEITSASA